MADIDESISSPYKTRDQEYRRLSVYASTEKEREGGGKRRKPEGEHTEERERRRNWKSRERGH